MSYSDPGTFVDGDPLPDDSLNVIGDDLRALKLLLDGLATSAVGVNRTTAQSIPDATDTQVVWNNQLYDIGSWWSSGADIIVPASFPAGVSAYLVEVNVLALFATNGTGYRTIRILNNGTAIAQRSVPGVSGDATPNDLMWKFEVAEGDVITVEVYQNSGGPLSLTGVAVGVTRLFPSA